MYFCHLVNLLRKRVVVSKKGLQMLNVKIDELREVLNNLSKTEDLNSDDVINISREMDNLILKYYISWENDLPIKDFKRSN
jgi:hypothetical protein